MRTHLYYLQGDHTHEYLKDNGYIVYNHLHYHLGVLPICMHIQSLVATKLGHLSSAKDGRRCSNEGKSAGPDDESRKVKGSNPVPAKIFLSNSLLNITGSLSCLICTIIYVRDVRLMQTSG